MGQPDARGKPTKAVAGAAPAKQVVAKKAAAKKAPVKKAAAKKAPVKKAPVKKAPAKKAAAKKAAAKKAAAKKAPAKKAPAKKAAPRARRSEGTAQIEIEGPSKDPMTLLGLGRAFTRLDLRRAWRAYAARHHPDQGGEALSFARGRAAYEDLLAQLQDRR